MKKIVSLALVSLGLVGLEAGAIGVGGPANSGNGGLNVDYKYESQVRYNITDEYVRTFLDTLNVIKGKAEFQGRHDYETKRKEQYGDEGRKYNPAWGAGVNELYEEEMSFTGDADLKVIADVRNRLAKFLTEKDPRSWIYYGKDDTKNILNKGKVQNGTVDVDDIATVSESSFVVRQEVLENFLGSSVDYNSSVSVTADKGTVIDGVMVDGDLNVADWPTLDVEQGSVNVSITDVETITLDSHLVTEDIVQEMIVYDLRMTAVASPIILDLDGDGKLEASGGNWGPHAGFAKAQPKMFDFYGDGFPVLMEWVGANDGILLKPSNDSGLINGTSFFGTATGAANGFEDLSLLDLNEDGALRGEELAGLRVWQDKNVNALVDEGELLSLDSLGISEFSVNHNDLKSSYIQNGQRQMMVDWCPSQARIDRYKISSSL